MNVNRFIAIDEYLEVSPIDRNRKLGRLDQLSNHIQRVSWSRNTPSRNLLIGKPLIAFKGRHYLKQYISMKPAKWGFKVFELCESRYGYCTWHIFYDGDKESNPRLAISFKIYCKDSRILVTIFLQTIGIAHRLAFKFLVFRES